MGRVWHIHITEYYSAKEEKEQSTKTCTPQGGVLKTPGEHQNTDTKERQLYASGHMK